MTQEPKRHGTPWKPQEDAILRRYYPRSGAHGCHKQGLTRTAAAIGGRAKVLGVRREPNRGVMGLAHQERHGTKGSTVLMWPLRPHRVTSRLFELAETPGLTLETYEARKAQILEGNA